jgi:hypothetical protein
VTSSHRQHAVPVTAKLSREFYERFADRIADELVNWFNQVDATYRSELRELNDLNFARFEAKLRVTLERRIGEQTRWLLGAWGVLSASVVSLWFRP